MEDDTTSYLIASDVDPAELQRKADDAGRTLRGPGSEAVAGYRPSGAPAFDAARVVELYERPVSGPAFTGGHVPLARWLRGPLRRWATGLYRIFAALERRLHEHRSRAFRELARETAALRRQVADLEARMERLEGATSDAGRDPGSGSRP